MCNFSNDALIVVDYVHHRQFESKLSKFFTINIQIRHFSIRSFLSNPFNRRRLWIPQPHNLLHIISDWLDSNFAKRHEIAASASQEKCNYRGVNTCRTNVLMRCELSFEDFSWNQKLSWRIPRRATVETFLRFLIYFCGSAAPLLLRVEGYLRPWY